MSIMNIVEITNKNWLKTEDGKWHHLAIDKNGDTYLNGILVYKIETITEALKSDPVENRWEILDIRK